MKPIINPWWIYLAEKSEALGTGFLVTGILLASLLIFWMVFNLTGDVSKPPRYIVVLVSIAILIGVLLPSQKTILTMMTVSQLTPNNITLVGNTIEDTIDYIIKNIEDLTDEDD